ncbi:50S ribosomal protein L29, partial [Dysosmobacter welbionis]
AGEPLASITGRGIISFFQSNNEIITAGRFCGGIYFLIRSIWITQADVLFERAVKQEIVLCHETDQFGKLP